MIQLKKKQSIVQPDEQPQAWQLLKMIWETRKPTEQPLDGDGDLLSN